MLNKKREFNDFRTFQQPNIDVFSVLRFNLLAIIDSIKFYSH